MKNKMEARKKAIKALKNDMKSNSEDMLDSLKGKMSVKVMSDSPEGLKEGLEKAEDMLESKKDGISDMLKKAFEKRKSSKKEEK